MEGPVAQKPPAHKRKVHVKLPKPTNVVDGDQQVSQETTNVYYQYFCTAPFTSTRK